jgi:DNA-binding NtrC family response regulator
MKKHDTDTGGDLEMTGALIDGKRILVVDDEKDILEAIEELLTTCIIEKATNFEDAKALLEHNTYDAAILDIMGVRGYDLLAITTSKEIPTLMLTAHALSPDNLVKSVKEGALAYLPKDMLSDIDTFLNDVLEAHAKGDNKSTKWLDRLEGFFEEKFGAYWKEKTKDPDFWKNYI